MAKKNAVLEKKIAEIKTQTALKEKARLDYEIATINEKVIEAQNECDSLDEKYDGLVEKYNSLVNTYNDTLRDLNAWRGAADWQNFMFDTLSETYYQGNEIVKYAVDSLISFANTTTKVLPSIIPCSWLMPLTSPFGRKWLHGCLVWQRGLVTSL